MDANLMVYLGVVVLILLLLGSILKIFCTEKRKSANSSGGETTFATQARQQEDVYNISGQVQGQEHQWPTHDAYVSIEHINIANQLNKPNYNDAPPSYEEAMRIAAALNESGSSTVVAAVPKTTN